MKLYCSATISIRSIPSQSIISTRKHKNAVLSVIKPSKESEVYLVLITESNRTGYRYKIKGNIEKTFGQFSDEGKCTIRFREPPHDLSMVAEKVPLKNFMLYIKKVWKGEIGVSPTVCKEVKVSQMSRSQSHKLEIKKRENYPDLKGFPNTLQTLLINDCKLNRFDNRIFKLVSLTTLNLSRNIIKTVPHELSNLRLKQLFLDNNKLRDEGFTYLSGPISRTLQYLDVSNNELKHLPPCLSRFDSLRILKVSKNMLVSIPFRVCLLPELLELDLSHNQLTALPGSLRRKGMKRLDTLDVSGNAGLRESETDAVLPRVSCRKVNHRPVPSLLEISGHVIICNGLPYSEETLPSNLVQLLDGAGQCSCGRMTLRQRGLARYMAEGKSMANTFVHINREPDVRVIYTTCSERYNASI